MAVQCCGEHLYTEEEVRMHNEKEHSVTDRRAVPLTVAGNDGLRRVVGRVMTDKDYRPEEILIDDPEVVKVLTTRVGEGSFQIKVE